MALLFSKGTIILLVKGFDLIGWKRRNVDCWLFPPTFPFIRCVPLIMINKLNRSWKWLFHQVSFVVTITLSYSFQRSGSNFLLTSSVPILYLAMITSEMVDCSGFNYKLLSMFYHYSKINNFKPQTYVLLCVIFLHYRSISWGLFVCLCLS